MANIVGNDWLNSNSLRNYPLSQTATLAANNAPFTIPDSLFVDLKLAIPYIAALHPGFFYISAITIYPQGMVFEVGYDDGTLTVSSLAVSSPVNFSSFTEYSTVTIKGIKTADYDFSQVTGSAVIGRLEDIATKQGSMYFSVGAGRLESTTVNFGIRRVSGVRVVSDSGTSATITGQVYLRSGNNHTIGVNGNVLTFNAVDGTGLEEACPCSDVTLGPCIRTINDTPPDATGNFVITGGDCIGVTTGTNSIAIDDSCAKPCCGCTELGVVSGDAAAISAQISTLVTAMAGLASQVAALQVNCLSSQVDPASCAAPDGGIPAAG